MMIVNVEIAHIHVITRDQEPDLGHLDINMGTKKITIVVMGKFSKSSFFLNKQITY